MAKNELLPFANGEDANILNTSQWEALTDIVENGFQSGIARSEQVNRVLAQGAVASYVLGQMIVDKLSKDATLDKDALYQDLLKALQENAKDACLPLVGGMLTGKVTSSSDRVLDSTNANGMFIVADASVSSTKTGCISVFPVEHSQSNRNGGFQCVASDGTNNKTLTGHYTNGLKWADKNVVTSVNGTSADANGNVTVTVSSVATATKATTTPNVVLVKGNSTTLPSGGTWKYVINSCASGSVKSGSVSGGTKITATYSDDTTTIIAIRTA